MIPQDVENRIRPRFFALAGNIVAVVACVLESAEIRRCAITVILSWSVSQHLVMS
jgi:hypothetical protein